MSETNFNFINSLDISDDLLDELPEILSWITKENNALATLLSTESFESFLLFFFPEFNPYPFQEDIIRHWDSKYFPLIIHSRQIGITTMLFFYAIWFAGHKPTMDIGFMIPNNSDSFNAKNKIIKLVESNPNIKSFLPIDSHTSDEIIFKNGSKIIFITPAMSTFGKSLDALICDDINQYSELFEQQTYRTIWLSCHGDVLLSGVPDKANGLFTDLVISKRFHKEPIETYDYTVNPELVTWIENSKIKESMDLKSFKSFFECQFPFGE